MKNLAGNKDCDQTILEELYLAGIPAIKVEETRSEVPYTFIGKIGNWTFKRAWYYWMVRTEEPIHGLPFAKAMELHHKKHPFLDRIMGASIRCDGHASAPSPDEYGAQPVYNDELYAALVALGYQYVYSNVLKADYIPITVGEVSKLYKEGKLSFERYVDSYHIDDQIGLNEFVKAIL